jgi:hypothetical protein
MTPIRKAGVRNIGGYSKPYFQFVCRNRALAAFTRPRCAAPSLGGPGKWRSGAYGRGGLRFSDGNRGSGAHPRAAPGENRLAAGGTGLELAVPLLRKALLNLPIGQTAKWPEPLEMVMAGWGSRPPPFRPRRDRRFESGSLQRRVCELRSPRRRRAPHTEWPRSRAISGFGRV